MKHLAILIVIINIEIMLEKTDEEIAALVQRGDQEIFGELVKRYQPKISRYGRKFLSNGEDIKDLVQDIFLKVYVNIRSLDTTRSFSSWIYRIAHNEYINALKKKGRDRLMFFDFDLLFPHPSAKETADGEINQADLRNMISQGLENLSAKYREPLVLYYIEEKNYKEIAEILRIPVSTVGVRLARGREILKKYVKQD